MEKLFETLVLAAFFGSFLKIVAHKLRIPAIVPLLIGGMILGQYGLKIIDPSNLGEGFRLIISICIGIILFEGGLSLEFHGYKKSPEIIRKLLTYGVLITWLLTAVMAKILLDFSIAYSLLIGSMIIVTGPTVISPLLQRIKVNQNLKHILNWEAVLIDPIGVFIAILCFEWLTINGTVVEQLIDFTGRFLTGSVIGFSSGMLLYFIFQKRIIPIAHNITFTLSFILLMYFLSNYISEESGLLAVVIAGFTFGLKKPVGIRNIKHFKLELSEIALSLLFILLAANLNITYFIQLSPRELLLIGFVVFLVRPFSIMVCTHNSRLTSKEKIFLSWIAPRGIVAASIASLFALELRKQGNPNAEFLEIFVYAIIILTVIIQGFTADSLSRILKLKIEDEDGWLIIGAHRFARYLALNIEQISNEKCYIVDTNLKSVYNARKKDLNAFHGDALIPEDLSTEIMSSVRNLLVLTDNEELNVLICERWINIVDSRKMFRWTENLTSTKYAGHPVWTNLPKPSQISFELKKGTTKLLVADESLNKTIQLNGKSLFTLREGGQRVYILP